MTAFSVSVFSLFTQVLQDVLSNPALYTIAAAAAILGLVGIFRRIIYMKGG